MVLEGVPRTFLGGGGVESVLISLNRNCESFEFGELSFLDVDMCAL